MDNLKMEVHKCALCHNAPCKKMYKNINPERIIRAIKFDNLKGAFSLIRNEKDCLKLNEGSKEKCPLNVDINEILKYVISRKYEISNIEDIDISTEICDIKLENPFLLSSSVVGSKYEMCKRALQKGWAGVVTKTICLMDIHESSPRLSALKDWDNSFIRP